MVRTHSGTLTVLAAGLGCGLALIASPPLGAEPTQIEAPKPQKAARPDKGSVAARLEFVPAMAVGAAIPTLAPARPEAAAEPDVTPPASEAAAKPDVTPPTPETAAKPKAVAAKAKAVAAKPTPETKVASLGGGVASLAGRWSGPGTLTPARGPAEVYKCVITYFPNADGSKIKQNLRCKGTDSKFDAATHLSIEGQKVSGLWQDNVYSLGGTVSGTASDGGFELDLDGQFFRAKMSVVSASDCEQSVRLLPADTSEMKEISAVLRRC